MISRFRENSAVFLPAGKKARESIKAKGFLTVYEGSVRSMKTVTSLFKWFMYVMTSPENVFLMSGNTLGSISRNCINGDYGLIAISGGLAKPKTDTDGSKYLQIGRKVVYYCGADNVASFKKIRGLTIGGWYADEINLQDRAFIETAFARSFASKDRQNIWTLNPDIPTHWIYTEYIDKYRDEKTLGYHWYHFTLDDNPALTEERKAEIAAQFTGVFYKRYVLGLRVRGEGGIYTSFVNNKKGEEGNVIDVEPKNIYRVTLACDPGGNKSATAFACVGWYLDGGKTKIVILDERYIIHKEGHDGVEMILREWKTFVTKCHERWPLDRAFNDSAEQLIKNSMNALGLPVHVEDAMKRPIIDRIRLFDVLFSQRRAHIMRHCKHTIEAFENAMWNQKIKTEERLDDGTTNIDSLDATEYCVERDASTLVEYMRFTEAA